MSSRASSAISQLSWAAQGVTASWGGRTPPSAGALYPLEVYVATEAALRRYSSAEHGADRHVQLEAGHACQNLLLEATALGLGAVPIGAFSDDALRVALGAATASCPSTSSPSDTRSMGRRRRRRPAVASRRGVQMIEP